MSTNVPSKARDERLSDPGIELTRAPRKDRLQDLLRIAAEALRFSPPLYLSSIFGPVRKWLPPHRELSEFEIVDLWRPLRTTRYLTAVTVPSAHHEAPALLRTLIPPLVNRLFWRPTSFFQQPDPFGKTSSYPGERWYFINGIATDSAVAAMNSALLARLFGRPITVIQNATNSLGLDLVECAIGKGFRTDPDLRDKGTLTEPSLKAAVAILRALDQQAVERVVVIAHSQGTIIVANVLRAVSKALQGNRRSAAGDRQSAEERAGAAAESLTVQANEPRLLALRHELAGALRPFVRAPEKVKKLEIYTFANCADKMKYVFREGGRGYPLIENFANKRDLVARLGVLAPSRGDPNLIDIDGPVYEKKGCGRLKKGSWGHLLNEHYLFDIADYLTGRGKGGANPYPPENPRDPEPRLYGYFFGGKPE